MALIYPGHIVTLCKIEGASNSCIEAGVPIPVPLFSCSILTGTEVQFSAPLAYTFSNRGLQFNSTGTKMYYIDGESLVHYNLATAWDLSTVTLQSSLNVTTTLVFNVLGFTMAENNRVFLVERNLTGVGSVTDQVITEFTLVDTNDVTSLVATGNTFISTNWSGGDNISGMDISPLGDKLFLFREADTVATTGTLIEYTMTSAFDLTTATETVRTEGLKGIGTGNGIALNQDGGQIYTGAKNAVDSIDSWCLGAAYDTTTLSDNDNLYTARGNIEFMTYIPSRSSIFYASGTGVYEIQFI